MITKAIRQYDQRQRSKPVVTYFACGPRAKCLDGKECDDKGSVVLYWDSGKPCGESVACSRCGSSAFERDLWGTP